MKKLVLIPLFLFLFSASAWAGTISLQWQASTEPDIGGYRLYYTEEGTATEQMVDVLNVTTHKLIGLTTGKYYLIEATAYDIAGNESERSYGVRSKARYGVVKGLEVVG